MQLGAKNFQKVIRNQIKNQILNKQDLELKRNARLANIKKLEKLIAEWDTPRLGFAGLRRLQSRLTDLKAQNGS